MLGDAAALVPGLAWGEGAALAGSGSGGGSYDFILHDVFRWGGLAFQCVFAVHCVCFRAALQSLLDGITQVRCAYCWRFHWSFARAPPPSHSLLPRPDHIPLPAAAAARRPP